MNSLRLRAAAAVAEQEKNALRDQLRERLNDILETRETARGLIMDVPDVLFTTSSATLTSPAREKLARVPLTAVDTFAFGESHPVASNDTPAGRKQNRRVELLVTGESIGRADPAQ